MESRFSGEAHSLYFGGGTPFLAPAGIIQEIIEALPLAADAEVTLEANPGSIDTEGLKDLQRAGVNRLSIGVQTFNQSHARTLGRGHTVQQARDLLTAAHTLGFSSWSMDLMFSLPDQTADELQRDLDDLLALAPPHVSLYGLSIEPGTPFQRAFQAERFTLPDPETWRSMYDSIVLQLDRAGLHRYEVSNFARSGHRAVHNEQVWRGGYYAGLGPGAHGFLPDGHRTLGHQDIDAWYDDPAPEEQSPEPLDAAVDYLLSSLRHIDGSSRTTLRQQYGFDLCQSDLLPLIRQGFIHEHGDHVRLTQAGFPLADGILRKLIDGVTGVSHT